MSTRYAAARILFVILCAGLILFAGCGGDGDQGACADNDGDGYGNPASPDCTHTALDCDDKDGEVYPGAAEGPWDDPICVDGVDNDCDGAVDGDDPDCPPGDDDDDDDASPGDDDTTGGGSWESGCGCRSVRSSGTIVDLRAILLVLFAVLGRVHRR